MSKAITDKVYKEIAIFRFVGKFTKESIEDFLKKNPKTIPVVICEFSDIFTTKYLSDPLEEFLEKSLNVLLMNFLK